MENIKDKVYFKLRGQGLDVVWSFTNNYSWHKIGGKVLYNIKDEVNSQVCIKVMVFLK